MVTELTGGLPEQAADLHLSPEETVEARLRCLQPVRDCLSTNDPEYDDKAFVDLVTLFSKSEWQYANQLNPEQLLIAYGILRNKKQVTILTGEAGTGKSFLVKALVEVFGHRFTLTATTGSAATVIGGTTVDRMFSIERGDLTARPPRQWRIRNATTMEKNMVKAGEFIVIDEASMIGRGMAEIIWAAIGERKKKVLLVGDWAQIMPVNDPWPFDTRLFAPENVTWAWLTCRHRQSDGEFLDILNGMRTAQHYAWVPAENRWANTEWLAKLDGFFSARNVPLQQLEDDPEWANATFLFATRREVAARNDRKLAEHVQESGEREFRLFSTITNKSKFPLTEADEERAFDNSRLAHELDVAHGCRVLITRNELEACPRYVNGDTGVLRGHNDTLLLVKLDRTGRYIGLPRMVSEVKDAHGNVMQEVKGFPVALGYALTAHKSQGATIPRVVVDMGSLSSFSWDSRHGLAYVTASRVRDPQYLRVTGWTAEAVWCAPYLRDVLGQQRWNPSMLVTDNWPAVESTYVPVEHYDPLNGMDEDEILDLFCVRHEQRQAELARGEFATQQEEEA